jgi:dTDP-4-dehydrorhamnose 3,5-epimerase
VSVTRELPTDIPGVRLFVRPAHADERGCFRRVFSETEYQPLGLTDTFVEDNVSVSKRGVLRGLHYDFRLAKFVQVLKGEIFDVVVDVRRSSPTFGAWQGFRLTASGCEQLYVPRGFAHGFYVLSDEAIMSYKQSGAYDPASEGQLLWNDAEIGIAWPLTDTPIISAKDAAAPPLSAVPA